jgi:integrase
MAKLTVKELEALTPADVGKTVFDDGGLRGKVRSTARADNGVSVEFSFRYRWETKLRDVSCGTWPADGLKAIREKRDEARRLLEERIDPAEYRKAQNAKIKAEAAESRRRLAEEQATEAARLAEIARLNERLTVRGLFERWASLELAQRKDGGAETRRGIEKDVLSTVGERPAEDVRRADVMAILDAVIARGANRQANRLLAEMRQMFGFAVVREIVAIDPTYGIKKKDVGGRDTERDRVLSDDEIRSLSAKLENANMLRSTEHAIWIMLATGCRIGELTGARRDDVSVNGGAWHLPDTKNGKPHTIFLSDFATAHLRELLLLSDDPQWLIPGTQTDRSVCSKSITKQIYDRQRGKEKTNGTKKTTALVLPGGHWVPHDLRRTAATMMQRLGVSGDVIERCLNHTEENKIKRVYQRDVPIAEMREAWRLLGERLALLTNPDAGNVAILNSA